MPTDEREIRTSSRCDAKGSARRRYRGIETLSASKQVHAQMEVRVSKPASAQGSTCREYGAGYRTRALRPICRQSNGADASLRRTNGTQAAMNKGSLYQWSADFTTIGSRWITGLAPEYFQFSRHQPISLE